MSIVDKNDKEASKSEAKEVFKPLRLSEIPPLTSHPHSEIIELPTLVEPKDSFPDVLDDTSSKVNELRKRGAESLPKDVYPGGNDLVLRMTWI